jgi:thiol-disulfide isomerase/thioredoxin
VSVPPEAGLAPGGDLEADGDRPPGAGRVLPAFPFGPGRGGYSKRTRSRLALTLALLTLVAIALGALLVSRPGHVAPRVVVIPAADRDASPALLRAAEAVGFEPRSEPGAGQIEGQTLIPTNPASASSLLAVGGAAPRFSLRTPTGEEVRLGGLRGRAVLLEFFATWCPHCAAEAPHLERLYGALPHARYAFVAVDADGETAPSVLAYHIYFGLSYPAVLDPSTTPGSFRAAGTPGPISTAYRVRSFPTFYVLDRAGRIVWAGSGEKPDLLLRRELERAAVSPGNGARTG